MLARDALRHSYVIAISVVSAGCVCVWHGVDNPNHVDTFFDSSL